MNRTANRNNCPDGPQKGRASVKLKMELGTVMQLGFGFKKQPSACLGGRGVASTAQDLTRFWRMVMNHGELDGVRILSRESMDFLTKNQLPSVTAGRDLKTGTPTRYLPQDFLRTLLVDGMGKQGQSLLGYVSNDPEFKHGRYQGTIKIVGMWSSMVWVNPEKGYCAVLMTNFGPAPECPVNLCAELDTFIQAFVNTGGGGASKALQSRM